MRFSLILAVIAVIALAARMANYGPDVADVQKVVEKPTVVVVPEAEDRLGQDDQRVDADPPIVEPEATPAPPVDPPTETPAADTPAAEIDHSQCPHPIICEQGDCQRDYAIIFSTEWCGPCKQLHKLADKLIAEGYRIYFWDAEKAPSMAKRFGISNVPTTIFFNHGQQQKKLVGIVGEGTFRSLLKPRPIYNLVP